MNSAENIFFMIFGAIVALSGVYGILRGTLTISLGDTDRFNRTVSGVTARMLSLGYVATGCSFFFVNPTISIFAVLFVGAATWALGSPTE